MTRGIEDFFGIPHLDDVLKEEGVEYKAKAEEEISIPPEFENLERALITMEGTDHSKSLDVIYTETLEHSRALMDLGFNVDDRSRRGIFEIASGMYKNAIDAKNSKRDMQLKLMKMLIDQRKQEFEEKKWRSERGEIGPEEITGKATLVEDRNELIKRLREERKD